MNFSIFKILLFFSCFFSADAFARTKELRCGYVDNYFYEIPRAGRIFEVEVPGKRFAIKDLEPDGMPGQINLYYRGASKTNSKPEFFIRNIQVQPPQLDYDEDFTFDEKNLVAWVQKGKINLKIYCTY